MVRKTRQLISSPLRCVIPLLALSTVGCGPMWYGPPPPSLPPGQAVNPHQFQQPHLVPTPQGPLQVPDESPPKPTFQGGATSGSLNQIPETTPEAVLSVPTPKSTSTYHDVKSGETLSGIAKKYGVTLEALRAANVFEKDPVLQPGQLILIP